MAELDMRSLVESAYSEAEAAGGESAEAVPGVVGVDDAGVAEAPAGTAEASGDAGGSEPTKADKHRDEKGKFAPKPKESQTVKPATAKTAAPVEGGVGGPPTVDASQLPAPVVAAEVLKAPQGLTPSEREVFAKAPVEIQKALARLDQSARQALMEAAPAKKFHQEFSQAVAPFEQMFQRSGLNPIQAAQSAFQTIHQLQTSDGRGRAQIFANLLKSYPTDIEALAGAIDGTPQQPGQPAHVDPRAFAAQVRQEVEQSWMQQRQQANAQRIGKELEAFAADPANEFFQDVMPLVTTLVQTNPKLSIAKAYEAACRADPGIYDIMQKRAVQQAAKATTASTQQARNAASSVKSAPSTGASSVRAPKTDRERIEAAWDSLDR